MKKVGIKIGIRVKAALDSFKTSDGESYDDVISRMHNAYVDQVYTREFSKALEREKNRGLRDIKKGRFTSTETMMGRLGLRYTRRPAQSNPRHMGLYWTKTASQAMAKLNPHITRVVLERAERHLRPKPRRAPVAWHRLVVLGYVFIQKFDQKNRAAYVLTIGHRPRLGMPFEPLGGYRIELR